MSSSRLFSSMFGEIQQYQIKVKDLAQLKAYELEHHFQILGSIQRQSDGTYSTLIELPQHLLPSLRSKANVLEVKPADQLNDSVNLALSPI